MGYTTCKHDYGAGFWALDEIGACGNGEWGVGELDADGVFFAEHLGVGRAI